MIIGITGKIGSGKHTFAKILEEKGFFLIDADQLAHGLYIRGSDIWHKLVDTFGKKILGKNYEINRKKLGKIVFSNLDKLEQLNQIIHQELKVKIQSKIRELKIQHCKNIVIVAALADKLNLKNLVDKLVLIQTPLEKRIKLLKKNRGMKEKDVLQIDELQQDTENYDVRILNEGSLGEFEEKVLKVLTDS